MKEKHKLASHKILKVDAPVSVDDCLERTNRALEELIKKREERKRKSASKLA